MPARHSGAWSSDAEGGAKFCDRTHVQLHVSDGRLPVVVGKHPRALGGAETERSGRTVGGQPPSHFPFPTVNGGLSLKFHWIRASTACCDFGAPLSWAKPTEMYRSGCSLRS